jgi:hypothetical protein
VLAVGSNMSCQCMIIACLCLRASIPGVLEWIRPSRPSHRRMDFVNWCPTIEILQKVDHWANGFENDTKSL